MLERIRVYAVVARVHHVVILRVAQIRGAVGSDFEGFVAAGRGDDRVCCRDGRDYILYHALGEGVCHARDVEFLCAEEGFLVEPSDVLGVVLVELGEGFLFVPGDDVGPFDAVFWLTGDAREGAEGDGGAGGMHVELAFEAGGDGWEDDAGLAFEAFGAAVDEGFVAVFYHLVNHVDEGGVDPAAGFDAVEAADDDLELHVEILVKVLDFAVVWGDFDAFDALLDEGGGDFGFELADV